MKINVGQLAGTIEVLVKLAARAPAAHLPVFANAWIRLNID